VSSEMQAPQGEVPAGPVLSGGAPAIGWTIPIVVVLTVSSLILGLALSAVGGQRGAGEGTGPVATALPLATHPAPYPGVQRLSAQEAQAKLGRGEAVLIDVRSKAAYDRLHAAGALSFPEAEIEAREGELPQGVLLILYCT